MVVEVQEWEEDTVLTSSACFRDPLTFLLHKFLLTMSFSVSLSSVPEFFLLIVGNSIQLLGQNCLYFLLSSKSGRCELLTRTFVLLGALIILVMAPNLSSVLPGASTSYNPA